MFDFIIIITTMQHPYKRRIIESYTVKRVHQNFFLFNIPIWRGSSQCPQLIISFFTSMFYMIIECQLVINFNTEKLFIITCVNQRFLLLESLGHYLSFICISFHLIISKPAEKFFCQTCRPFGVKYSKYAEAYHITSDSFKGCLPQILLGLFLNTLPHL